MGGKCVAVAGATGNAGRQIVRALSKRGQRVRALVRNPERLGDVREHCAEVREVQVTEPESLSGALDGVEILVSALGKTYQKDKTPRRAVDVEANRHLFAEAKRAGVGRIGLVSVWGAGLDQPVEMLRMKGEAEAALEEVGLPWIIFQPSGFFSDMWEVLRMCRGGTFWAFGSGLAQFNPIALEDLADFIAQDVLDESTVNVRRPVGGPDVYDAEALAALCGRVLERKVRVRRVPMWLASACVSAIRPFSRGTWELADFFVGSSALAEKLGEEAVLPRTGHHHLEDYLRARAQKEGATKTSYQR